MKFDIITIFPKIFDSYFNESIIKRAKKSGKIKINIINLRDFSADKKYRKIDDSPYGGGAGMVLMAEPILKAVSKIVGKKKDPKTKIVVLSAKGKQFNQKIAYDWSKKLEKIIFVSSRYEGVDERVIKALHAEELSIGPYVLTDGDAAAMVVISAIIRLIPGVIKLESLKEESHWNALLKKEKKSAAQDKLEYPHYTRPEVFKWLGKKYAVPRVLLSGDHKKIENWRRNHQKNSL